LLFGLHVVKLIVMTGLEIFDRVAYGQTLFHRDADAWDLIDEAGLVAAVLSPRAQHLSISLPQSRVKPAPVGRRIPYGEKVKWKITQDTIDEGISVVTELARS
jgi:hypothetical protein